MNLFLSSNSMIGYVAGKMQGAIYSESVDPEQAWNDNSIDLVNAAKVQRSTPFSSRYLM